MSVGTQPGYQIGREGGMTTREREVLAGIAAGETLMQIAKRIGVSKQRVDQIAKALTAKGRLKRDGMRFTIIVPRG